MSQSKTCVKNEVNKVVSLTERRVRFLNDEIASAIAVGERELHGRSNFAFPNEEERHDAPKPFASQKEFDPKPYDERNLSLLWKQGIYPPCIHCGETADDKDFDDRFICKNRRDLGRC